MASPGSSREYADVQVLLIYFSVDWDAEKNARHLGRACKALGYKVTRFVPDSDLELDWKKQHSFKSTMSKLGIWVRAWIKGVQASPVDKEQLFFIYFGGHGCVASYGDGEHLIGAGECNDEREDYEISLTRVQQLLRKTGNDLVFLFECCNADTTRLALHGPMDNVTYTIETLAAGKGTIDFKHRPIDFSQRFANELSRLDSNSSPEDRTVKSIFDRVYDEQSGDSPGHYLRNQGQSSITLPVLPDPTPLTEDDNDSVHLSDEEGRGEEAEDDGAGDVEADV